MRKLAVLVSILFTNPANAGLLSSGVAWVTEATSTGKLVLNNDDFDGAFADNPNHFKINNDPQFDQSIVATERIIPTEHSGGITEYAVTIFAGYDETRPGDTLDTKFMVQLGFGTGGDFVRAGSVAPDLVFDQPDNVSPPIEDFFVFFGDTPILELLEHQGDTLIYQGSSTTGGFTVGSLFDDFFLVPLDIPDLPESARDFYVPDQLQDLASTDIPFTIRITPVPEPSAVLLGLIGMSLVGFMRARSLRKSHGAGVRRSPAVG